MKRIISLPLALVIFFGMAVCASASPQKVVELSIFCGGISKATPTGTALQAMIAEIEEKSGGSIKIKDFYDTELGDSKTMIQSLVQGTIDMGITGCSYYAGLVPEIQVFELPFLFENVAQARAAVNGPARDIIFEKLAARGIIGLSFWENGLRNLTNNVRPVESLADLQGMKIRTLPAKIQIEAWKALGALPTPIDAAELYTALHVGTVSGQENPYTLIRDQRFYEVQPYLTETRHVYTPFFLSMSKISADKLTPEQLQIVKDAAVNAQKIQHGENDTVEAEAKAFMIDYGIQIVENIDLTEWRERVIPVYAIFTDEYGTEILETVRNSK